MQLSQKQLLISVSLLLAASLLLVLVALDRYRPAPVTGAPAATPTDVLAAVQPDAAEPAPAPTPTDQPAGPVEPPEPQAASARDLLILAMPDGLYTHLFAYHPVHLPLTRLTDGPHDDISPAVDPTGTRVAYASRESGFWDIYLLDLTDGSRTQLTDTPEYDGHPSWSPDGLWLVYETYLDNNLELVIQGVDQENSQPIRLTQNEAADFSPAWSPQGREIAFVSDRSGDQEIWSARLDFVLDRFVNLSGSPGSQEASPRWGPDGQTIAWSSVFPGSAEVYLLDRSQPGEAIRQVGGGRGPVWSPDGRLLAVENQGPNATGLAFFSPDSATLAYPPVQLPGALAGLAWFNCPEGVSPEAIGTPAAFNLAALYEPIITAPAGEDGRTEVVPLKEVKAPFPYLHDAVNEAFDALRAAAGQAAGWDVLFSLENAFIPLTDPVSPGGSDAWLKTGRGFALDAAALQAGWMVVVPEHHLDQTYWRVYVKARRQDGSQGQPLHAMDWDLDARSRGDLEAYENGGVFAPVPSGYWVDFTDLAARFGWKRLPAMHNWRSYYPAARFNQFVHVSGLDWTRAMLELYPAEVLTPEPGYDSGVSRP